MSAHRCHALNGSDVECFTCERRIAAAEDARSGRTTTRDEDRLADFAADEHFLGRD